jgi:tetratricopeptide (TPR) repeat protein
MTVRILAASAAGIWLLLQGAVARADPAAAEVLFRDGRALLELGEVTRACEKLEASNTLDPSAGTLLNLAACRLKQGKTATAWAHFVAAERLALNQGRSEQAAEAKQRALELEPQLSTLTLLAPHAPSGLEVRRGGQVVQPASLGTAVPVDPGRIVIEAGAPGYETARLEITIAATGDRRTLEIPRLQSDAGRAGASTATQVSASPPRDTPAEPTGSSALPWAVGGVSAATLIAGSVLGGLALSSNEAAIEACDAGDQAACDERQARRDGQALASTVCVGVGLIGLGVSALWLLSGGSKRPESAWSYGGEVTRQSAVLKMRVGF